MRLFLSAVVCVFPVLGIANESLPRKRISLTFLPHGSELKNVMFPRYDETKKLTGSLKADAMTLVDDNLIAARNVKIEFYQPDQSPRGTIELPVAKIDQARGFLTADGPVLLQSDRLHAAGTLLTYDYASAEVFLRGPGTVEFLPPPATSMHVPSFPRAALMAGFVFATSLVSAEETANSSPTETHARETEKTATSVKTALDASIHTSQKAKQFLDRTQPETPETPKAPPAPSEKSLEISQTGDSSRIAFDGGVYSDMEKGEIVFLKNVRVYDPRFELTGANELIVYLTPKKTTPDTKKKDGAMPSFGGLASSDIDKIVATGVVRMKQRNVEGGKAPVEASGKIFTYHPKSGTMTLTGGFPWVLQGNNYLRAREANLTLRIEKNGDFHTSGPWDLGGRIDKK